MRLARAVIVALAAACPAPLSARQSLAGPDRDASVETRGPEHRGVRARLPLPAELHMRNRAGVDGLGLCVFTSIEVAALCQGITALAGLQEYMTHQPGGGYPEKVDEVLRDYLGDRYDDLPYLHAYGADAVRIAEAAVAEGYMVCQTYGFSPRYTDESGRIIAAIAHMVNTSHLDAEVGAVIDNNFPGTWEWSPRAEWETRLHWQPADRYGRTGTLGEGWVTVFLVNPLPPAPPEETAW